MMRIKLIISGPCALQLPIWKADMSFFTKKKQNYIAVHLKAKSHGVSEGKNSRNTDWDDVGQWEGVSYAESYILVKWKQCEEGLWTH